MKPDTWPTWAKLVIAALVCVGCGLAAYGVLRLFGVT